MNKQSALDRLTAIENEAAELRKIIDAPEKPTPEEIFWQLCEGLTLKIDKEKYPNSTFLFKDDKYFFEYDSKNRNLWCSYKHIWGVFEKEYSMQYSDIQSLIKLLVEEHFKCKGITPLLDYTFARHWVEEHFKCKGITPLLDYTFARHWVEEHFKCKGITPSK